jgi:hypothetical protein
MALAFCPLCSAEVSVGPDGRCENGHLVPGIGPAGGGAPVEEPEPWVARVEPLAPTPAAAPPSTDSDDLVGFAPDVPEAMAPLTVEPEHEDDDLDLDALEAAVAELGVEFDGDEGDDALAAFDEQAAAETPTPPPTTATLENWAAPAPTQTDAWASHDEPPAPALFDQPVPAPDEPVWAPADLAPAPPAPEAPEAPEEPPPPPPPPPATPSVDLSNFSARGPGRGRSRRR